MERTKEWGKWKLIKEGEARLKGKWQYERKIEKER